MIDKNIEIENDIIVEKNSDEEYSPVNKKKKVKYKEDNFTKRIKISEKSEKKKNNSKTASIVQNSIKNNLFGTQKLSNNKINPPNKRKNMELIEGNDIDNKNFNKLIRIISSKNNDIFISKCKQFKILEDLFCQKFYQIINYELDNIKENIENIKLNNPDKIESIRNYIENGLLIPIISYFKKIFTLIHYFSGEEIMNIFCLIEKSIKLKLFISELKTNLWSYTLNENTDEDNKNISPFQYYYISKYKNPSIIDQTCFINKNSIDLAYDSLNYIKSGDISPFDYTSLYQIVDLEFFSLIKERKELNINIIQNLKTNSNLLNKKKMKNEEKLLLEKTKTNTSDMNIRFLKALIVYRNTKLLNLNENNSSLLIILPELTLDYETNYRNLLIEILINYGKEKNIKDEFADISYFLLFKLLFLQTSDIHNELINIIGDKKNKEFCFLKDFINIFFNRIVVLFIEYLNPSDNLIQPSYFTSFNLIFIFKYLCKEHNNYFQRYFINNISFTFIENNPSFFNINEEEEEESYKSNSSEEDSSLQNLGKPEKTINFNDFLLYL